MLEVQDDRQIALREQLDEKKDQYQQALQTEKDLIMQVIHKYKHHLHLPDPSVQ